jgi:hypothetical protein
LTSQNDHEYAAQLECIVTSSSQQDACTKLRTELVNRLAPSRDQNIQNIQLLTQSQFPRYLRRLAPDVPDALLHNISSSRPSCNAQAIPTNRTQCELDAAALYTDHITDAASASTLEGIAPTMESLTPLRHSDCPSQKVEELGVERNSPSTHRNRRYSHKDSLYKTRYHYQDSSTISIDDTEISICWYHRNFGARARNCTKPCAYWKQEKPDEDISTVADVYTTDTGRPFVTDKCSKQQFLIDTGSELSVCSLKLVPEHKKLVSFELFAANGSSVPTYGWLPLTVDLGLRRNFAWTFVVADVTYPLIGADFLSHFGLLVDCRNNCLLERRNVVFCSHSRSYMRKSHQRRCRSRQPTE